MPAGVGVTALAVVAVATIGMTIASALDLDPQSGRRRLDVPGHLGALVVIGFGHLRRRRPSPGRRWHGLHSLDAIGPLRRKAAAGLWAVALAIGATFALAPDRVISLSWLEANTDLWNSIGTVIAMLPPILLTSAVALGLLGQAEARRHSEM